MARASATKAIASYSPSGELFSLTIPDFEEQLSDPAFNPPGNTRVLFEIDVAKKLEGAWIAHGLDQSRAAHEILRFIHAEAQKVGVSAPRMPIPVKSLNAAIAHAERGRDELLAEELSLSQLPPNNIITIRQGQDDEEQILVATHLALVRRELARTNARIVTLTAERDRA